MAKTGHKNFDMIDCNYDSDNQFFEDELSLSFNYFQNSKNNGDKTNQEYQIKHAIQLEFMEFFDIRDFDLQS